MIRRPPRSTPLYSSAASDVYKRQTPESLLSDADAAMYLAKRHGRARATRLTPQLRAEQLNRIQLEQGLQHALEQGQLTLAYQPIYPLTGGPASSVEALPVSYTHLRAHETKANIVC